MRIYLSLLFVVLITNLYALMSTGNIKNKFIRVSFKILLVLSLLRYISLYIFLVSESPNYLYNIRYFVLFSGLSIPVTSFISIKLMNEEKVKNIDTIFISIISVIYIFIILNAPYGIISKDIGYSVAVKQSWTFIIASIQGFFSGLMIYFSLNYFVKIKVIKNRLINLIFLSGFMSAIAEGLVILFGIAGFRTMIISEGIILIAVCSALNYIGENKQ